ncbi:SIMPL domain-containing protein [Aliiglaciecola sp. CAU 1673]|uniref:SIMPL domain-containing protein n=1 Tax=Aliiglaciecola sp. CAU 1673 TaxID=3032595 RepID=UPI0023DB204E|nr:SIMPL domain-containing protein [Aliiglaciecola sp. CAU 1673]MDF2178723.1 SIMPL domain-containing protein [Aliiglaciecola sp. CAU 1673]
MNRQQNLVLAIGVFLGLTALGYLLGNAAIKVKEFERTVQVKGLSEREVKADQVIWPIAFTQAGNDLAELYQEMEKNADKVRAFLVLKGIDREEINIAAPMVTDKLAQQWGGGEQPEFRYTANQVVTVYSAKVDMVRSAMQDMVELGKQGLVVSGNQYEYATEFMFTGLNEIKPEMIEEATKNARAVAQKFAQDSDSRVGKIRQATQGQFSIENRDRNTPYIKKVRVVSTIEYYLAD